MRSIREPATLASMYICILVELVTPRKSSTRIGWLSRSETARSSVGSTIFLLENLVRTSREASGHH